jgi:Secretion system C-terminal sorting domain
MKIMILLLLVFSSTAMMAQQIVATAGGTLGNASGSISYTIGEGIAQTFSRGDKVLTQGFQQSYLSVSTEKTILDLNFSITVFPNPTTDVVTLRVAKENPSGLLYLLYDLNGRLLSKKVIENSDTTVPFQSLQTGTYLLEVMDGKLGLKTFKIIKH